MRVVQLVIQYQVVSPEIMHIQATRDGLIRSYFCICACIYVIKISKEKETMTLKESKWQMSREALREERKGRNYLIIF